MGYDNYIPLNKHIKGILHYKNGNFHHLKNSDIFPADYISLTQYGHLSPLK